QLLVSKVSTELMHVLPWVSGVVLAAILPMIFCRVTAGRGEEQLPAGRMWPMLRRRSARLGINGCVISGILLGSLYGLMPLYLSHQGISDATV
ncbi:MFS transporter, partial [Erwinia amylovora]|nr:MFS transporter [Erwinia amylovora]